jgi:hypothetical protein
LDALHSIDGGDDRPELVDAARTRVRAGLVLWLHAYKQHLGIAESTAMCSELPTMEQAQATLEGYTDEQEALDMALLSQSRREYPPDVRPRILECLARMAEEAGRGDVASKWRKWKGPLPAGEEKLEAVFST